MKRTTKLALCGVLAVLTTSTVHAQAQDAFPDTPANHWAYEAKAFGPDHWAYLGVLKLQKAGLLKGYSTERFDFRGTSYATRYELAIMIHAAYLQLKTLSEGLDGRMKDLAVKAGATSNDQDLASLRAEVAAIQEDVRMIKAGRELIEVMKRATDSFELELEQLGVKVEGMRKELSELTARVEKLEQKKPLVDISGDINLWVGAGNSRDEFYGLNKDGRILGSSSVGAISTFFPPVGDSAGLTRDLTILHEGAFRLSGTAEKGLQWAGTIVIGNMIGPNNAGLANPTVAFGNQSDVFNPAAGSSGTVGAFGYATGSSDIYLQDFGVKYNFGKVVAQVGRIGVSVSPYVFLRIDNTTYFDNARWDNGKYTVDGAMATLTTGRLALDVFGGNTSSVTSKNGTLINPLRTGVIEGPFGSGTVAASGTQMTIDRALGINAKYNLAQGIDLRASTLWLDADDLFPVEVNKTADRLVVSGFEASAARGLVQVTGGYRFTTLQLGTSKVIDKDNAAWNAAANLYLGKYTLGAEYREIQANYLAPGDWGRLAVQRNPVNLKGFILSANAPVSTRFAINGSAEFDKGISNTYAASSLLSDRSKVDSFKIQAKYILNAKTLVTLGYEDTRVRDIPGALEDAQYRWTTLAFHHQLSQHSTLKFQYELSDVDNDYQVSNGASFRGGFFTTQLSLKF